MKKQLKCKKQEKTTTKKQPFYSHENLHYFTLIEAAQKFAKKNNTFDIVQTSPRLSPTCAGIWRVTVKKENKSE